MSNNLFQGIGLFVCIGGIILLVLIAIAASRLFSGRRNPSTNRQDRMPRENPQTWETRGGERPRVDSPEIQSRGGFGRPGGGTGGRSVTGPRESGGFGGNRTLGSSGRLGDSGRLEDSGTGTTRNVSDQEDDDNIRSSGGFGGG